MTIRVLGVVAVFGLGVGIGCAAAPLVVPKASAQQAAQLTKWEYVAAELDGNEPEALDAANKLGREGWEQTGAVVQYHGSSYTWFKRPKL